jgi:hypothetical protein
MAVLLSAIGGGFANRLSLPLEEARSQLARIAARAASVVGASSGLGVAS